ncbi:MAG: hypothetical protein LBS40_02255 [Burkholderiales bacterium]|nr:hypothetical protein [Burkholderiales bacterium]
MKEDFVAVAAKFTQAQNELAERRANFFKTLFDGVNVVFELTSDAEKMVKNAGIHNIHITLPGILLWPASGDELSVEGDGVEIVFTVLSRRLRLTNGKLSTVVFRVDKPQSANGRLCFFRAQNSELEK